MTLQKRPIRSKLRRKLRAKNIPIFDVQELERRALFTGGGELDGTFATPPSTIDLTAQGTADWSHWGDVDAVTPVYKSSDNGPTNFTTVGTPDAAGMYSQGGNPAFSWSDGTPIASETGDVNGVFSQGVGSGFELVLPADTQTRFVQLYVGAYNASATLTATLSDESADDYTDSSIDGYSNAMREYDLTYSAASAGQTLTIQWVENSAVNGSSYVSLQAMSLAAPPAAPTDVMSTSNTASAVTLEWTGSSAATSYSILREAPGESSFSEVGTTSDTSYTDTDLDAETTYQYEIAAVNSLGTSAPTYPLSTATIPGVSLSDGGSVDEGDTYTVSVTPEYTGTNPMTSLSIDWGDGDVDTETTTSGDFTHVYDDSGKFLVSAAEESIYGEADASLVTTITDPTPTLDIAVSDTTVEQGTSITVTPMLTMNSIDQLNGWVVDWGDGTIDTPGADATPSFTHAYAHGVYDSGVSYAITVAADTSVGVFAAGGSINVTAPASPPSPPTPPSMWISSDETAVASQPWDLTVLTCGVTSPPSSYSVDFGDGSTGGEADETADLGGGNIQYDADHTYAEPGLYYVTAGDMSLNQNAFFQVNDTSPSIASVDDQTVDFGSEADVTTTVSGLNVNETYLAFIQWGEGGAARPATLTTNGDGTGTITGSLDHAYDTSTAVITLYDQDGNGVSTTFGLDASSDPPDFGGDLLVAPKPAGGSSPAPAPAQSTVPPVAPPQDSRPARLWADVRDCLAAAPTGSDGSPLLGSTVAKRDAHRVALFRSRSPFASETSPAKSGTSDFSDPLIGNDPWAQNDPFPFALAGL